MQNIERERKKKKKKKTEKQRVREESRPVRFRFRRAGTTIINNIRGSRLHFTPLTMDNCVTIMFRAPRVWPRGTSACGGGAGGRIVPFQRGQARQRRDESIETSATEERRWIGERESCSNRRQGRGGWQRGTEERGGGTGWLAWTI